MADWHLLLGAFLCFFIAGTTLVIILLPKNNQKQVENRLLELADDLGLHTSNSAADKYSSNSVLKLINNIFQRLRNPLESRWQPFHLHLQALAGEKALNKTALILIAVLVIMFIVFSPFPWYSQILSALSSTGLSAWLYYQYLYQQQIKAYEEQLPSTIEHLARAVSTGLSVPQGLSSCAQSSQAPVNKELQRLAQQLTLGIPLEKALTEAQQRIPVREFSFLSIILILNQQTGGRLSEALNNLATSLRDRKAMRLKLSSLTSEPRAAANIVSAFPVLTLLGLWLFNRDQWNFLWHDPSGQSILLYAIASVTFGLLLIRRLARGGIA